MPGEDGHTPRQYLADMQELIRQIDAAAKQADKPVIAPIPGPKPTLDPWCPFPYPKMVDLVVPKPAEGAGFTRCRFRRDLIEAFGTHITDGPPSQTRECLRDFFGTGAARQWDALTDLGISYDGRCGLFNDWRDPERGGTRAGWANGWGHDGPGFENGGQEFYRRFPEINVVIVSCDHFQKAGGKWSDAMIATTIEVRTALIQERQILAASYPINPRTGLSFEQQHRRTVTLAEARVDPGWSRCLSCGGALLLTERGPPAGFERTASNYERGGLLPEERRSADRILEMALPGGLDAARQGG